MELILLGQFTQELDLALASEASLKLKMLGVQVVRAKGSRSWKREGDKRLLIGR
jgi:hypothetical protein